MTSVANLVAVSLLTGLSATAHAADITLSSRISAVSVYPQGAGVTRAADFDIPAGPTTLVVAGLPEEIAANALRISGIGDGVSIESVETVTVAADSTLDPAKVAIEKELRNLGDQMRVIDDKLAALDLRARFVDGMVEKLPDGLAKAMADGKPASDWIATSASLGQERGQIDAARQVLAVDRRALQDKIDDRQQALEALPAPRGTLTARIQVAASRPAKGRLELGYRTVSAGWSPAYDVSLALGDGPAAPAIELVRRADITQSTGEDWTDVALTLATSRPSDASSPPEPFESIVRFQPHYASDEGIAREAAPRPALMASPAPTPEPLMKQSEAVADFGDFRGAYRVAGPVSVASDAGTRSVRLATEVIPVQLEARAVPARDETAFLVAKFANESGAPYLGGPASLYRDGDFVGVMPMAFVAPGSEVVLGFGADDKVAVKRTVVKRATGEQGIISSQKTDERRYLISVENRHARPMTIAVLDGLPVAEDERITVTRLRDATPPTEEAPGGVRGVAQWRFDYAPGEARAIRNEYAVAWPANEDVFWEN